MTTLLIVSLILNLTSFMILLYNYYYVYKPMRKFIKHLVTKDLERIMGIKIDLNQLTEDKQDKEP